MDTARKLLCCNFLIIVTSETRRRIGYDMRGRCSSTFHVFIELNFNYFKILQLLDGLIRYVIKQVNNRINNINFNKVWHKSLVETATLSLKEWLSKSPGCLSPYTFGFLSTKITPKRRKLILSINNFSSTTLTVHIKVLETFRSRTSNMASSL